jgi:GT2 family glycosyltransferase
MFISVVIPTYNLLDDCIASLDPKVQNPSCNYEVIVSDDKVPSDAKKMLEEKYPWAKWLEGPHKGAAANRNNGAKHAKGDWVVFIDSDCISDKNLINAYIKAIQNNPEMLVFEGCIRPEARKKRHFLEEAPINETGGYFWTCNVMIQKDYFGNILKGFDEEYIIYQEDADIRERIKLTGQPILFLKEAFVIHPWRLQKNPVKMAKLQLVSYQLFCSKHPKLAPNLTFVKYLRREFIFYVKNVIMKIIPYRGRGVFIFIKAHIVANKFKKVKFEKELNKTENWTSLH